MNNFGAKIIIAFAACLACVSYAATSFAAPPPLVVDFESQPLFSQSAFLPGDAVTHWVKATNNSGSSQQVGLNLTNFSDPDGLASQLRVTVKNSSTVLYDDTMDHLDAAGEIFLLSLPDGATKQFDISVTFNPAADNSYQGKSVSFDINIGFQGQSGNTVTILTGGGTTFAGGGGGGGGSPAVTPAPNPTPTTFSGALPFPSPSIPSFGGLVAGTSTSPSGQIGEGAFTIKKLASNNPSPAQGKVLGEATSSSSVSPNVLSGNIGQQTCTEPGWRPFIYVLYFLLLALLYWLLVIKNRQLGIFFPASIALALAAILFWWFSPCSIRPWYWPPAVAAGLLILLWQAAYSVAKAEENK